MKVRLAVSKENYERIKRELTESGIEIDDSSELMISESNRFVDNILVKDRISSGHIVLSSDDIVYIESFGHSIEVHTQDSTFQALDRLYKLCNMLDPDKFLRISNSVIIAKNKVKMINPTLTRKFILTMANGRTVDVTRSYYYIFKESFGI